MADLKTTVLAENTGQGHGLLAEHGLSFWIEVARSKVLFDTGQGLVLRQNAERLGIRLDSVDTIVLSHGHYDHTGGLADALEQTEGARVFAHPAAFTPKFARNQDGTARDIGMAESIKQTVRSKASLHWVETPTEIGDGIWCTGPIPRTNNYEDTGGAFFRDDGCSEPDEIQDDQATFLEMESGTVVILGCAHAGIINTLHFIRTLTANRPIHAVLGGMHLLHASPQRMETTIAELRRLDIERLIPCHCTGFAAMAHLWNEFLGHCETIHVGSVVHFEGRQ